MKCTIPEISWHNREPVLSINISPINDEFYRLATGGADCHVLIWQLNVNTNGGVKIEALSDLTRHQKAVNCVRWSPNGSFLASADDDANIIIWQLKTDNIPLLEGETGDKETWIVFKVMRGHKEDIYDLSWSPDGLKLLSGSIDNTAILWDVNKAKSDNILPDHKGFVQGVCWDPKNRYLATLSTDRTCRILDTKGKHVKYRLIKGQLPVPESHYLCKKEVKYFHDDTFKSFFRRLDFSPDANLIATPSGRVEVEDYKDILYATYIFLVDSWSSPVAVLPTGSQCSTVVKFCPILFELNPDGPESTFKLPYRMILAIGTDHDVILYDTQQLAPFAYFKDIHYTRLTDLSWSSDGSILIASSTDGFCALITFDPDELGTIYRKPETESILDVSGCELLPEKIEVDAKPKRPSLLEKWTIKTPNKKKLDTSTEERTLNKNKVVESSGNKKQENKSSPLMKFLKKPQKKTTQLTEQPVVVLDETEARDAWKCEQKPEVSIKEDSIEENMDDFHLQLEESTQTRSKNVPEANTITESKNNDKNCGIEPMDTQPIHDENNLNAKSNIESLPVATIKRRIPLITLSSPKQKKKDT